MLKKFIWKKLWKNGNFTLLNKPLEPYKLLQALSRQRLNFSHLNEHNFATISGILLTNSAFLMQKLKLLVNISCVNLCFPSKEQNSLKALVILTIHY